MKSTPWGQSQHQETLAPGIVSHSTAGHGGIWLDDSRRKQLEFYRNHNFLKSSTWWEEDCDWAIPYIFFASDIQAYGKAYKFDENLACARNIACHFHPEFFKTHCA